MLAEARRELEAAQAEIAAARASIARREAERARGDAAPGRSGCGWRRSPPRRPRRASGWRCSSARSAACATRSTASADRVDAARERAAEDEARLTAVRDEISRGEMELETLREEAHRRRSRLASLTEIQDRYERFQKGVRAIMQEHRAAGGGDGIKAVVADIVRPPPELETAVEAVLGERLGNVIVDSHEAGVEAIQFLKRTREGRSSFIPRALRRGKRRAARSFTTRRAGLASRRPPTPTFVPPSTATRSPRPGRRATACAGRCSS